MAEKGRKAPVWLFLAWQPAIDRDRRHLSEVQKDAFREPLSIGWLDVFSSAADWSATLEDVISLCVERKQARKHKM